MNCNKYFDFFHDETYLWWLSSCEEEYWSVHWCIKHNLSWAAIDNVFRNCMTATMSNFTVSHSWCKRLNECPALWASTVGNPKNSFTIVWPIQITLMMRITRTPYTAIMFNASSFTCYCLYSRNICPMGQQRNWKTLKNISTWWWNHVTGGAMNRYVSWISSLLRWFWLLQ